MSFSADELKQVMQVINVDDYPQEQWNYFIAANRLECWVAKCPPCVVFGSRSTVYYRLGDRCVHVSAAKAFFRSLGLVVESKSPRPVALDRIIYQNGETSEARLKRMDYDTTSNIALYLKSLGVIC